MTAAIAAPDEPIDGEVACPSCAEDRCEHDLWVCPECGGPDCTLCNNVGVLNAQDHPDWCNSCGLSGKCRHCDEDYGKGWAS